MIMEDCIRKMLEENERLFLSSFASFSDASVGRLKNEPECNIRTVFQRDRDRIIHSKSFRRLKHKTQVFLSPTGDHYRTRLTHTLEVSQIARTIAKSLRLNEDLTEAIALGHDLGHTPFGHAGEEVLNSLMEGGFYHFEQSLRVVDILEREGSGLNLTFEVRDGIVKHSKGKGKIVDLQGNGIPCTLEGQVVRVADIIAYISHDMDDALRAGILKEDDIKNCYSFAKSHSKRIDTMVRDVISNSKNCEYQYIAPTKEMEELMESMRDFLYERLYEAKIIKESFIQISKVLEKMFHFLVENFDTLEEELNLSIHDDSVQRNVCDFIAGMSDRYALSFYERKCLSHNR
ncbi:MAG: deoxyguanosinetriphosphate triphosphohydrolase [Thermodesulfobacteriota bacterium]|nr:deoxyguanosinetriphosphate triphosphohydrolase [Thermodesulfobacteriota bacterium]